MSARATSERPELAEKIDWLYDLQHFGMKLGLGVRGGCWRCGSAGEFGFLDDAVSVAVLPAGLGKQLLGSLGVIGPGLDIGRRRRRG